MEVRAKKMIIEDHHRVRQYRLDLNEQERKEVFLGFLDISTQLKHEDRYHTISNNCMLAIFNVLDERIRIAGPRKAITKITGRTLFMPTKAPRHLRRRGLKKRANFQLVNLEEELGWEKHIDKKLYKDN